MLFPLGRSDKYLGEDHFTDGGPSPRNVGSTIVSAGFAGEGVRHEMRPSPEETCPPNPPLYVCRERRGPSALPEHDYFDFREQIPAFLLPAVHRSRPAPRVPKPVPLEAKQGIKCSYRDKNRDAGSGSAPAEPFTRAGSGVVKRSPIAEQGQLPARRLSDNGTGRAAVPAPFPRPDRGT